MKCHEPIVIFSDTTRWYSLFKKGLISALKQTRKVIWWDQKYRKFGHHYQTVH